MSDKPWHEDKANLVDLARWMKSTGEYLNDSIVLVLESPEVWGETWQEYQASLQPKEPTLSERFTQCYGKDSTSALLAAELERQSQRLEALEAKERER